MQGHEFKNIACYVLSQRGLKLAQLLRDSLSKESLCALQIFMPEKMQEEVHIKDAQSFKSLPSAVATSFNMHDGHIFICATGIAVRCIAPHLEHKKDDPAVVVCDEKGLFAISLLSGHFGGGNSLATQVAKILGGQAVITTASDVHNTLAVDMLAKKSGFTILDWEKIKLCNGAILDGERLQLYDPLKLISGMAKQSFTLVDIEKNSDLPRLDLSKISVGVHWRKLPEHENFLRMTLPALHMGIGCKRGTDKQSILAAIDHCLTSANLEKKALVSLASVDMKADELGLREAAQELGIPITFYPAETLAEAPCLTPSGMAAQLFGLENISVSEGAALTSAFCHGAGAEEVNPENMNADSAALIVPKIKFEGKVTVAVAIPEHLIPNT